MINCRKTLKELLEQLMGKGIDKKQKICYTKFSIIYDMQNQKNPLW